MDKSAPIWNKGKLQFKNHKLPSSLRMVISGNSGSGKTTLLLKMILFNLDFDRLVICSPSLPFQMEYKIFIESLQKGLSKDQIVAIFEAQDEIEDPFLVIEEVADCIDDHDNHDKKVSVLIFKDPSELPSPEKLKESGGGGVKTLIIIDDCMNKEQSTINDYFTYSRPLEMNLIYLSQSFFKIDKNSARDNANVFIFFSTTTVNQQNIFRHLASDRFKTCKDFKDFATKSWDEVKDEKGKKRGYIVYYRDSETFDANCF